MQNDYYYAYTKTCKKGILRKDKRRKYHFWEIYLTAIVNSCKQLDVLFWTYTTCKEAPCHDSFHYDWIQVEILQISLFKSGHFSVTNKVEVPGAQQPDSQQQTTLSLSAMYGIKQLDTFLSNVYNMQRSYM